jgi:hypothetical protein
MLIIYKILASSDKKEIVGYDSTGKGSIILFTEKELKEINAKPENEQEAHALVLASARG